MGQLKLVALASCRWLILLAMLSCVFLLSLHRLCPSAEAQTGAMHVPEAEDGQWVMPAKNYASTRYSGLEQITTGNIKDLKVALTFSTGLVRGHEGAPLVVNNTLYIVTPFPNYLYALDLTQPGAPTKWKYDPKPAAAAQGVACCDLVNRGAAYAHGNIFL